MTEAEEIEQLRVQLAGCGATALGYGQECKRGDYGWSASLGDVQRLYARYVKFFKAMEEAQKNLGVPGPGYPANVAEAYDILSKAMALEETR